MQEIKTLIDKASKVCGSDTALASRMGVKVQVVSMLRNGRTITPETAAELADIAGESVKAAVYQAMIERSIGTRREGVLREILGKSLLAGVAAMSLFSYAPDVKAATIYNDKVNRSVNFIYIVEYQIFIKIRHSSCGAIINDRLSQARVFINCEPLSPLADWMLAFYCRCNSLY